MQPRILLTGFKPFGSLSVNPTEQLMRALATEKFAGAAIETVILDVDYVRAEHQFRAAVTRFSPNAILSFGVAGGADTLRLERIAVNIDDADLPDSGGQRRAGTRIVEQGPVGYWATLDLEALYAALVEAGLPVRMSNHAGAYLCNHLLYYGLHLTQGTATRMGFVHVPPLPEQVTEGGRAQVGMALETLVAAARVCVRTIARDLVCMDTVSGL
jgi:pyroglutamyl-peptidase